MISLASLIILLFAPGVYGYECSFKATINPEKGLRGDCTLTADKDYSKLTGDDQYTFTLCFGAIVLENFLVGPLPSNLLDRISGNSDELRSAGMKPIIRIQYSTNSTGIDTSLYWVESHLNQLQPIFESHAENIAWFEAGIIGAWGEWHSSSNGLSSLSNRQAVWDLLHRYLPTKPCLKVTVRTPQYIQDLVPSLITTDEAAYADDSVCTEAKRVGFHNDCWLSGWSDYGTYQLSGSSAEEARQHWLPYASNATKYSSFGGETCIDPATGGVWSELTCDFLMAEAAILHAGFLNPHWHPLVTAYLQENCCWEEFVDRLGYRFELSCVTLPTEISPGRALPYSFIIRNTGFGRLSTARRAYLVLRQVVNAGDMTTISVDGDTSDWSTVTDKVVDAQGDGGGAAADLWEVSVANDDDFVYFRVSFFEVTAGIPFDAGYYRLFFNIDSNPTVGFSVNGLAFRSSFMLHGNTLYDQRSGTWSDVRLPFVPDIRLGTDKLEVEIRCSRAWTFADGTLLFPNKSFSIQAGVADTSWEMSEFSPNLSFVIHTLKSSVLLYEHDIAHDLRTWSNEQPDINISGVLVVPDIFQMSSGEVLGVSISLQLPDASSALKNNLRNRIQLHPSPNSVWDPIHGSNVLASQVAVVPSDKFETKHPYPKSNFHVSVSYVGSNCLKLYFTDKTCTTVNRDTLTIKYLESNITYNVTYSGCQAPLWPRLSSPLTIPSGTFESHFYAKLSKKNKFGYAMVVTACGATSAIDSPPGAYLGSLSKRIDISERASDHRLLRVVGGAGCMLLYFSNSTRMRSDEDYVSIFKDTSMDTGTWGRSKYKKKHADWPMENNPLRIYSSSIFVKYRAVYSKHPAHFNDPIGSWGYAVNINKCD